MCHHQTKIFPCLHFSKGIKPLAKITTLLGLAVILILPTTIHAQFIGGDFMNSQQTVTEDEQTQIILEEIEKEFIAHAILGYKNRQINCLAYKPTRTKTLSASKALKKILLYLPDGYKIMIVGHANKTGREYTEKGSIGNDYYSTMRAKSVYDYMIKKIPDASENILIGGFGSHRNQRMVTFKILPQKQATAIHKKLFNKHKW